MGIMKTAFDANVLIYFLGHSTEFGSLAGDAIESSLKRGGVVFSTIAIAEYLSHPISNESALRDFLTLTDCVPVSELVAVKAADIRKSHNGIRLPDALHLATALVSGAATFITHDNQLLKLGQVENLVIKPLV